MSENVFTQLFSRHKQRSAQQKVRTQEQEDVFLATLANGRTYADEAIFIVRAILVVLTAFVIYLGYNYYLDTFMEMFPAWAAYLFAFLIPLVVEAGKIKLSMLGLRSILFCWWWKTWASVAFWGTIIALSFATFWWSYSISTGGIKEVSREKSEVKNELPPLEQVLATATADIDAQIAAITVSNTEASSMKTKKGKTTWAGQSIQMNNSATLPYLQEQRMAIAREKTIWYNAQSTKVDVKVNRWAAFIERFGGWGEWGTLLCILAIGFFERRLREANMEHPDDPNATKGFSNNGQSTASTPNTAAVNNQNSTTLGFKWAGYGQTPQNTASQTQIAASQQTQQFSVLGCDAVLKQCERAVRADLPSFKRSDSKPKTVSGRINRALDNCYEIIQKPDFTPTRDVGAAFYKFMAEIAIPTLNDRGWPYERDSFFMKRLLDVIPNRAEA